MGGKRPIVAGIEAGTGLRQLIELRWESNWSYLGEAGRAISGGVENARRAQAGSCQHGGRAALQADEGRQAG